MTSADLTSGATTFTTSTGPDQPGPKNRCVSTRGFQKQHLARSLNVLPPSPFSAPPKDLFLSHCRPYGLKRAASPLGYIRYDIRDLILSQVCSSLVFSKCLELYVYLVDSGLANLPKRCSMAKCSKNIGHSRLKDSSCSVNEIRRLSCGPWRTAHNPAASHVLLNVSHPLGRTRNNLGPKVHTSSPLRA